MKLGKKVLQPLEKKLLAQEPPVLLLRCPHCRRLQSVEFNARKIITTEFAEGNRSLWNVELERPICWYCSAIIKTDAMVARQAVGEQEPLTSAPVDQFLGKLEQSLKETFKKKWDYNILMENGMIHIDLVIPYLTEPKTVKGKSNAR